MADAARDAAVAVDAASVSVGRGGVGVAVTLDPIALEVRRRGRPLVVDLSFWSAEGTVGDQFVHLTEGVIPHEDREPVERLARVEVAAERDDGVELVGELEGGRAVRLTVAVTVERVVLELEAEGQPLRLGASWATAVSQPAAGPGPGADPRAPQGPAVGTTAPERFTGLGARHGLTVDQAGRWIRLGADRTYTGPDCPPDMLDVGGIPQGDYAPAPWLLSSAGYAVWTETGGEGVEFDLASGAAASPSEPPASTAAPAASSSSAASSPAPPISPVTLSTRGAAGPLRLHLLTDPTPAARLRHYCRLTGFPALLPEWGYGHWKSRDVYEHQRDVVDDFEGYERHAIPLDAVVVDSPWETQYNTWRFNPHQFPDPNGMIERMRAAGVRTVVWITPWVNLESVDGQRPPDRESERLHREPAPNYAPAAAAGHFVKDADGEPFVARWWMGTGSPVDFTSTAAEEWWRELARPVLEMGVEGIKADDGEGYYFPPEVRFADGRTGAEAAWAYGDLYRRSMQRALDEVHPGRGVLFGRSGWSGQQRHGICWGGDQASDFWSLRALVAATLTAAASGFSNWSHDVGGYLGRRLVERCSKELLLRWVQFGCFTPLMHAHGRFRQEAWTYDQEALDLYRSYVLLHERLVPYVRAAATSAARSGLPIVRPLCLTDPEDPRGWEIADAYGYGPALWVAPVLEAGAEERSVYLPRGEWIDFWTGEHVAGGRDVVALAPFDRIPVWVRSGSLMVTYPAEHVATGLGDVPEAERPLEATLWGEPVLGRASARLADETRVRWRRGSWSVTPARDVTPGRAPKPASPPS